MLTEAARNALEDAPHAIPTDVFEGAIPSMKVQAHTSRPMHARDDAWPNITATRQRIARQFPQLPQGARDAVAFITTQPGLRAPRRDVDNAMHWSNPTSRRWLGEARDLGCSSSKAQGETPTGA